jgi:hypothetical protein
MFSRLIAITLGTLAGAAVPLFDLVAFTDGYNWRLDMAHSILLEASKEEVVTDSGEPCAVNELAQRILTSISVGLADIPSLAAAISVCNQVDRNSVIDHVKQSISSQSIVALERYRSFLELGRQNQQANLNAIGSLYAAGTRDIESRSRLLVRFIGWFRILRDQYANGCASTRPVDNLVRPLTHQLVAMLLPLENMNSPTDEHGMLQIRSQTRAFVSGLNHEDKATIGHALRRAYAIVLDRNTDWKEDAKRALTVAHQSLVTEHPYFRIVKEIGAVNDLIGQIHSHDL